MENSSVKIGDAIIVTWNKSDESAYGGAEGVVFGITGDKIAGEYLIIDRSVYESSFKSALSQLGVFDFRVIPINEIVSLRKAELRKRPLGATESFKLKMEANYISNIDFEATAAKLQSRKDCKIIPIENSKSGAEYGKSIKEIKTLKGVTINILNTSALHIYCYYDGLENCLKWIEDAVELFQGHKRLVLFPKKVMYTIHDSHKEHLRPAMELLYRIAMSEKGEPVVFPVGWAHWLFSELDVNPLQELFPNGQSIEKLIFDSRKRKKNPLHDLHSFVEEETEQEVKLRFPWDETKPNKYLGSYTPVMRITGVIKTPEQAKGLMEMWLGSRSDVWQWGEIGPFSGKTVLRDLTINRKTGVYTLDYRKYSGNDF